MGKVVHGAADWFGIPIEVDCDTNEPSMEIEVDYEEPEPVLQLVAIDDLVSRIERMPPKLTVIHGGKAINNWYRN